MNLTKEKLRLRFMSEILIVRLIDPDWYGLTLWERLLKTLREANKIAREVEEDELGWVEINDLCRMNFHTPAQRKQDLIEKGYDVRCELRESVQTHMGEAKLVWKYRLFETDVTAGWATDGI